MTSTQWLLAPAFIHVAIVMVQGLRMAAGRTAAFRSGRVKLADADDGKLSWPAPVRHLSETYSNQFEIPVLFYAILAFLLITGFGDNVQIVLAWVFAAARIVQTVVHTTTNNIRQRGLSFGVSVLALLAMWIWFGLRLYAIG
ncbi:MAPEG family protein [soil metagenome]